MFRRLVAALVATAFLCTSTVAQAGLGDALGAMVNMTPPSAVTTADRGALVGGSYTMRLPTKTYNLFYFDPPRISAGCGGIDLFMGSFSFLNADAFKGMIKSIAQAAAGYFFITALGNICPDCAKWLSYLQSLSTMMNQGQLNTCKVGASFGSALANSATDNMDFSHKNEAGTVSDWFAPGSTTFLGGGANADWVKGIMNMMGKSGQDNAAAQIKYNSYGGNLVWRAMVKNSGPSIIAFPTSSTSSLSQVEFVSMIISLIGTTIIPIDQTKFDGTADQTLFNNCQSAADSGACEAATVSIKPDLKFMDITKGHKNGRVDYWRCTTDSIGNLENDISNDLGCLSMKEMPLPWPGTEAIVNYYLFCDSSSGAMTLNVTPNDTGACYQSDVALPGSIISNIASGTPLTNPQRAFLSNFKQPVYRMMVEAQRTPMVMTTLAKAFAPEMAGELTGLFTDAMLKVIATSFSKNSKSVLTDEAKVNIAAFRKFADDQAAAQQDFMKTLLAAAEYVKLARGYDPILISTPKSASKGG